MVYEHEYRLIKNLINKVMCDIDNFTVIDHNTLKIDIGGYISIIPLGVADKTSGIEVYESDLVHFNNYKMLKRAFSYLYYEIAEKGVRDEIRKMNKEHKLRVNHVIDYLKN